jgi:hypothetical protein
MLRIAGTPEGCRESTRLSYDKHMRLALKGKKKTDDSPHHTALYGALGTWYKIRQRPIVEHMVWGELIPFLLLPEKEAKEALSEYTLYLEDIVEHRYQSDTGVKIDWLAHLINDSLRAVFSEDSPYRFGAAMSANYVGWHYLLAEDVKAQVDAELEKIRQGREKNPQQANQPEWH